MIICTYDNRNHCLTGTTVSLPNCKKSKFSQERIFSTPDKEIFLTALSAYEAKEGLSENNYIVEIFHKNNT